MGVLYVIQTFDDEARIRRLVGTILGSDPRGHVVVSHNSDGFEVDEESLGAPSRVDVVNRPGGNRVDFYQVDGYLDALSLARRRGFDFDWVVNLTGQCYPVRPLAGFADALARGAADAYLFHRPVEPADGGLWPVAEAQGRYGYRYRWRLSRHPPPAAARLALAAIREVVNRSQRWICLDTTYGLQVGVRAPADFLPVGWRLHGGFHFMALGRLAADRLLAFCADRPDVVARFRQMNLPSEVFAHTVLANQPDLRLSQDVPLYVDYSRAPGGRPRVLTSSDVDTLVASGYFFARKFDLRVDAQVLERLDEVVLAQPAQALSAA